MLALDKTSFGHKSFSKYADVQDVYLIDQRMDYVQWLQGGAQIATSQGGHGLDDRTTTKPQAQSKKGGQNNQGKKTEQLNVPRGRQLTKYVVKEESNSAGRLSDKGGSSNRITQKYVAKD